jgi:hypothetical protein
MKDSAPRRNSRDALLYTDQDGTRRVFFDPTYPSARINFSIAHEITHTFFPNSRQGTRFRNLHDENSREANELERLCDLGASELLMPQEEFSDAVGCELSLRRVPELTKRFGSSFEATTFRLATSYDGLAVAGLLRYRLRKEEERSLQETVNSQQSIFPPSSTDSSPLPIAKYRRQSFHMSEPCGNEHHIPWNKSFDVTSCVYRATESNGIARSREALPNRARVVGQIEAVLAPFQRPDANIKYGDVLFLWWN